PGQGTRAVPRDASPIRRSRRPTSAEGGGRARRRSPDRRETRNSSHGPPPPRFTVEGVAQLFTQQALLGQLTARSVSSCASRLPRATRKRRLYPASRCLYSCWPSFRLVRSKYFSFRSRVPRAIASRLAVAARFPFMLLSTR